MLEQGTNVVVLLDDKVFGKIEIKGKIVWSHLCNFIDTRKMSRVQSSLYAVELENRKVLTVFESNVKVMLK